MLAYYAGEWRDAGKTREVENPYDQSVIDTVPELDPTLIDEAVRVAREGASALAKMAGDQLGQVLQRSADSMYSQRHAWAETITREEGKPLAEASQEVDAVVHLLEVSAREAFWLGTELTPLAMEASLNGRFGFTVRQAYGVVVAVTPYVYPLLLPATLVVPALIAGNSVILKPSGATPLSALRLVGLLLESGLPGTSIACLTGDGPTLGLPLSCHPLVDKMAFMGSRFAAAAIRGEAGLKTVDLQWGGVGVVVVSDDADLERASTAIVERAYENAGQIPFASPWVLAAQPVYAELVERLQTCVSELACGDPLLATTHIGPLINRRHAENVAAEVKTELRRGAKCRCGGRQQAAIFEPTLICDVPAADITFAQQELLGPVVGVSSIQQMEDAERYLDPQRQHVVSIFSTDTERMMHVARSLSVTNIHVNGIPSWRDGLLSESRSSERIGRHTVGDRAATMTAFKDVVYHP
jgi:glyceraldehyde-3-phosphate dehydrogenase (NADP+)